MPQTFFGFGKYKSYIHRHHSRHEPSDATPEEKNYPEHRDLQIRDRGAGGTHSVCVPPAGSATQGLEEVDGGEGEAHGAGDQENGVVHDEADDVADPGGQGGENGADVIEVGGEGRSCLLRNSFFLKCILSRRFRR